MRVSFELSEQLGLYGNGHYAFYTVTKSSHRTLPVLTLPPPLSQRVLSLSELAHSKAWTAVSVNLEAQAAFWVPSPRPTLEPGTEHPLAHLGLALSK